jgi:magnesium chelatase family protein
MPMPSLVSTPSPWKRNSVLAQRLPTILPPLTATESLETTRIYRAMGRLSADEPLMQRRPFRRAHHTSSDAGDRHGDGGTPRTLKSVPSL